MMINQFKVIIEGDFVDSYIYSGYLLLVDSHYTLSVYKWERIVDDVLKGIDPHYSTAIKGLLKDSRSSVSICRTKSLEISKEILCNSHLFSYEIGVWPTDLNIFSNNLYISSEQGVTKLKLEYETGRLTHETQIFNEMVFTISPNSHGRLAFAAGQSGVLSYTPFSRYFNPDNITQFIESTCVELDWQSTVLFAETLGSIVRCNYKPMPKKSDKITQNDYFNLVEQVMLSPPDVLEMESFTNAWVAGDKTFAVNKDGTIYVGSVQNNELNQYKEVLIDNKLIKARTAAFGTVLETDRALTILVDNECHTVSDDIVSWRVFPRARNYANQLHAIKDDYLELYFIESVKNNIFGFEVEKIDFKG